jgi:pre-mRNA-processing factor 40
MQERKNREAFRELLKEYMDKGKLSYKTRWSSFIQTIKDDPRFLNMVKGI